MCKTNLDPIWMAWSRVWPNTSGPEASRCAGIIGPGFWQDATGPLPVSPLSDSVAFFHKSPDHIVQNRPRSNLVLADWFRFKLQALVYDILPSTTAVFSYAIGSWKLSANEQFFVGAQTVVSLSQTTQIIPDICFITDHVAYASSNKTKIIWIEMELFFFLPGVDAPHVYVRAWALGCFHSLTSTQTFRRALTASLDSCAEIKNTASVA